MLTSKNADLKGFTHAPRLCSLRCNFRLYQANGSGQLGLNEARILAGPAEQRGKIIMCLGLSLLNGLLTLTLRDTE